MKTFIAALYAALLIWPGNGIYNAKERQIEKNLAGDTIYENIYISDVSVGGLTEKEAETKLYNHLNETLNKRVVVGVDAFKLSELGGYFDISQAISDAWLYAREGSVKERYRMLGHIKENPLYLDADYLIDLDTMNQVIDDLSKKLDIAPTEPEIILRNGRISVSNEKPGKSIDKQKLRDDLLVTLKAQSLSQIKLAYNNTEPRFKANDLRRAASILGSSSTELPAGQMNRMQNIVLAASRINGTVIMPGEVFSTNNIINPGKGDHGYLPAGSYLNGKVVDSSGGGVCQVATTLYMALLNAELPITERQNHSMNVAYADFGFDATLAEGLIDLKFKNDTDLPVTLSCSVNGNRLNTIIYGVENRPPDRSIRFENELIEVIEPPEWELIHDPLLPDNTQIVEVKSRQGRKYKLYKLVYLNNRLIDKVLVNTSTYKPVQGRVRIGGGKPN